MPLSERVKSKPVPGGTTITLFRDVGSTPLGVFVVIEDVQVRMVIIPTTTMTTANARASTAFALEMLHNSNCCNCTSGRSLNAVVLAVVTVSTVVVVAACSVVYHRC